MLPYSSTGFASADIFSWCDELKGIFVGIIVELVFAMLLLVVPAAVALSSPAVTLTPAPAVYVVVTTFLLLVDIVVMLASCLFANSSDDVVRLENNDSSYNYSTHVYARWHRICNSLYLSSHSYSYMLSRSISRCLLDIRSSKRCCSSLYILVLSSYDLVPCIYRYCACYFLLSARAISFSRSCYFNRCKLSWSEPIISCASLHAIVKFIAITLYPCNWVVWSCSTLCWHSCSIISRWRISSLTHTY